jgi:hypothetical protein
VCLTLGKRFGNLLKPLVLFSNDTFRDEPGYMSAGERRGKVADGKCCICSTMENAFPQKPFGWPWAHGSPLLRLRSFGRLRLCARALGLRLKYGSGLDGLWLKCSDLAGSGVAMRVMQQVAGPAGPMRSRTRDQWFLWEHILHRVHRTHVQQNGSLSHPQE